MGIAVPRLEILLTVLTYISKVGHDFICIFDANISFELASRQSEAHRRAYQKLKEGFPDNFVECTGGTKADPYILMEASERGGRIISNDQYRDYVKEFPWLMSREDRLSKVNVIRDNVYIDGKKCNLQTNLASVVSELEKLLRSGPGVQAKSP